MAQRLAAAMALLVFAICLMIGGIQAENTFSTTVSRALMAMGGTFIIGLVVGSMGQRMINEHLTGGEHPPRHQEKSENAETKPTAADR